MVWSEGSSPSWLQAQWSERAIKEPSCYYEVSLVSCVSFEMLRCTPAPDREESGSVPQRGLAVCCLALWELCERAAGSDLCLDWSLSGIAKDLNIPVLLIQVRHSAPGMVLAAVGLCSLISAPAFQIT